MRINELGVWEAFFWVAQEKNFTRAADRMKIGVPLLSKRIARLEEELGTRLFHRSTRKVNLTDEGLGLVPHVTALLEDLHGLEGRFDKSDQLTGSLRITSAISPAYNLIAPLLVEFMKRHPNLRVEFELSDGLTDLIDSQMDVAIRVDMPSETDLVYKKLIVNDVILCASPEYLQKHKAPKTPRDLRQHPLYILENHEICVFKKNGSKLGDYVDMRRLKCEAGTFLTAMILNGGGIGARSLWEVAPLLKNGRLVQVLPEYPLEPWGHLYAVIPSRRFLAPRVRAFIDFMDEQAKKWEKLGLVLD